MLRQCIMSAWDELDQRVIDTAVKQWRTRLHACVKAKCGYHEHTALILTPINIHTLCVRTLKALLCVCAFCFNKVPDVRYSS